MTQFWKWKSFKVFELMHSIPLLYGEWGDGVRWWWHQHPPIGGGDEREYNNNNNNNMNDCTQRIQSVIAKHQLKWITNNKLYQPYCIFNFILTIIEWMRKVFLFISTKRYMYTLMLSICTELYIRWFVYDNGGIRKILSSLI